MKGIMLENNSSSKNIHSYCGKCRLNMDHTVMTMDGETVLKVRCKMCGSSHKYRIPLDPQKIETANAKREEKEEATAELVWEAGLAEAKGKERDYDMAAKYRVGEVVIHRTFGKGIVIKIYVNKCDMLFKDRERLMVSANAPK